MRLHPGAGVIISWESDFSSDDSYNNISRTLGEAEVR
jgi:hypothetical protein